MSELAWGVGLFLAVWCAHLAAWKVRVPKAGRRMLFLVFLGALPPAAALMTRHAPAPSVVLASALYLALALAYLALYVAIEGDSPTAALTGILAGAEPAGMTAEELGRALGLARHLRSRLELMVTDGMAEFVEGRYRITGKGRRLLGYYDVYGRIAGTGVKSA